MDMVERAEEVLSASPQQLLKHLAPVLLGSAERAIPPSLGTGAKRVRALRSLAKAAAECGDIHVELHSRLELCVALLQAQQPSGGGRGPVELVAAELTKLAHLLHAHDAGLVTMQALVTRLQGLLLHALQRMARAIPTDSSPPVRGAY